MSSIRIDSLSDEIGALLEEYGGSVAEDMKKTARHVAGEAVKELKQISPEGAGSRKGHYKDGWGSRVLKEDSTDIEIVVYNRKKPGLTHLLEEGHAKRGGGRVEGIPHISATEQKAVKEYEKQIKGRLRG